MRQVYATIAGEPVIFHLTSMEALRGIFYRQGLGQNAAALIVAAVMVPLGQARHFFHTIPSLARVRRPLVSPGAPEPCRGARALRD